MHVLRGGLVGGLVCVLGLHKSGTHIMTEYMEKYFNVLVEPPKNGKNEGTIAIGELYSPR